MSNEPSIRIVVTTDTSQAALLSGLEAWLRLGVLNEAQISIEVTARASHPEILSALDSWLSLGLLSDAAVKKLCRDFLTCPLPQVTATQETLVPPVWAPPIPQVSSQLAIITAASTKPSQPPNRITQILLSLQAELSLMWFLFLGVFMVIFSSGVLVATQWNKFPASGQYGVLFGYTLSFWVVGYWASRQSNLSLTSRTLQIVSLLLVPVNFWAMDSFRLWRYPGDWIIVAATTIALSAIVLLVSKIQTSRQIPKFFLPNYLLLSFLHWGWGLVIFPPIAIYLGIGGTIASLYLQGRRGFYREKSKLSLLVLFYAIGVLLFRAIFVARLDIHQLGLAVGACGWLVLQAAEISQFPLLNEMLGSGLLIGGWLVTVGEVFPWQALAISGLGIWLTSSRLIRFWRRFELAALLAIGLQTIWLCWRLVPQPTQYLLVTLGTELTNSQNAPYALLSVVLFPYVLLILGVARWLYRRRQPQLAEFGEGIAFSMGAVLTTLSLVNPLLRTINLLVSTVTLGMVTRRSTNLVWLYITHITGLGTLASGINYLFPNLTLSNWAVILLTLMVAEWGFSVSGGTTNWRRSAWYLGLVLAGLSYILLVHEPEQQWWGVLWLIAPLSMTGVATRSEGSQRKLASWLSVVALGMAQFLIWDVPGTRLIGLGVATGLMLVNTRYIRQVGAAAITVGFGLSCLGIFLWEGIAGLPRLSESGWLVVGALALTSLWVLRNWLKSRSTQLAQIYAQATDGWGLALCSLELILLTFHSLGVYWAILPRDYVVLIASILTMGGIACRSWVEPNNWAFYGLGWSLELFTTELLSTSSHSTLNLTIANIALGLITQIAGDWWQRRAGMSSLPTSWNIIPLLYGILAIVLRVNAFTSWTGLYTLALAVIAIGVGRRREEFKPLVYLALVGISVSAYEVLFYQISHQSQGNQYIAMAALGTSIMYAYRVLSPMLTNYLPLSNADLKLVSHLHWGWSSFLLLAAMSVPIQSNILLGLGTSIFLSRYAIMQGRNHPVTSIAEAWVYLGLLEAAGSAIYIGNKLLVVSFRAFLAPWAGAIACLGAYFIYVLPWSSWGWPKKPWQNTALIVPLVAIGVSITVINSISLLIVAGFYILLCRLNQQIRFTYISAVLIDWVVLREFLGWQLKDPLWYVIPIGLSLLYVAQVDPDLKLPEHKQQRHSLRLVGSGFICLVALLSNQSSGVVPGAISCITIFAGLAFRIRAFLLVGTATFVVNGFYQLGILIFSRPFLKWVIGFFVGIAFIGIAAIFETRREQIRTWFQNWMGDWESWD